MDVIREKFKQFNMFDLFDPNIMAYECQKMYVVDIMQLIVKYRCVYSVIYTMQNISEYIAH